MVPRKFVAYAFVREWFVDVISRGLGLVWAAPPSSAPVLSLIPSSSLLGPSDTFNQEKVFYTVIGFFLSFFAVFAAFLYPNR